MARSQWGRIAVSALIGVPFGIIYGLVARFAFANDTGAWGNVFATMTLGFLCFVPIAVGALTVFFAPTPYRTSGAYAFFMPWLSTLIWVGIAWAIGLEAGICLIMAFPLLAFMASIGGILVRSLYASGKSIEHPKLPAVGLLVLLLLPYFVTPIEQGIAFTDSYRTVENSIVINAAPDMVWNEIVSVPTIQPQEQGFSVFHTLGLPRPLSASISQASIGGVRDATFEGGLSFVETVDEWQPQQRLSFHIQVDKLKEQPAPLNMIGSQYLDILRGAYEIEPLGNGQVRLHLSSQHRLSTHFNTYGGVWSDLIMWDLQRYILEIIKARAEL